MMTEIANVLIDVKVMLKRFPNFGTDVDFAQRRLSVCDDEPSWHCVG